MELTIELMYDMRSVFLEKDEEKKVSLPFTYGNFCKTEKNIYMNLPRKCNEPQPSRGTKTKKRGRTLNGKTHTYPRNNRHTKKNYLRKFYKDFKV